MLHNTTMKVEEKVELLTTPAWSLKQLMDYLGIKSRTTGARVKERAFNEYNGRVPYGNQYVRRDAILAMYGTTYEKEMEILNEVLYKRNLQN